MSKTFYEMAKKNYPTLWNIEMLRNFTRLGRITPEQFGEITGEPYDG